MAKTFKELNKEAKTIKEIKKAGLSLAIIFNKGELDRFGLCYGDKIDLDEAKILKSSNK